MKCSNGSFRRTTRTSPAGVNSQLTEDLESKVWGLRGKAPLFTKGDQMWVSKTKVTLEKHREQTLTD